MMCGSTCVDTQSDYQNCGGCGKQCTNEVCSHGACATVCGGGTSRCGSDCVDLLSDVNNCGMCANACPSGNVCSKGTCALTCQSGLTNCSGDCVDVTQDDSNCGACNAPCGGGQVCTGSTCVATCGTGWTTCPVGDSGTTCANTQEDTQNCGTCGNVCPEGYLCSPKAGVGTCGLQCNGGTSKCSNECVDENIDPGHCGSCTTACTTGETCSNAHCCPSATPYYCGGCDTFADCVSKEGGHIIAGDNYTCAINPAGAVYCWGDNDYGEAGTGDSTTFMYDTAQAAAGLSNGIISLGAGEVTACAITGGGLLYCWGDDSYGELGDNTTTFNTVYSPESIGLSNVIHAAGTYDATCWLLGTGAVECAGEDDNYEIANGSAPSFINYVTPSSTLLTSGVATIAAASAGFSDGEMFCAVLTSGSVKCWGTCFDYGFTGSLGDGTTTQSSTPITVSGITTATSVSVSDTHACIVLSTGALECWGDNTYGEVGNGKSGTTPTKPVTATLTGVSRVAVGSDFTCALTTAGAVECVGYNCDGELGNGKSSCAATTAWQTPIASGAIDLAAGGSHACALLATGKAQCWGNGSSGQVGNGTYNDPITTPKTVSGF